MHLTIRTEQCKVFEEQSLRTFATEVASTLAPILADQQAAGAGRVTNDFVYEQLQRAEMNGLERKNELMAWTLCALVHGADFDQKLPRVSQILADRHYDRSVLFTQLALEGLKKGDALP